MHGVHHAYPCRRHRKPKQHQLLRTTNSAHVLPVVPIPALGQSPMPKACLQPQSFQRLEELSARSTTRTPVFCLIQFAQKPANPDHPTPGPKPPVARVSGLYSHDHQGRREGHVSRKYLFFGLHPKRSDPKGVRIGCRFRAIEDAPRSCLAECIDDLPDCVAQQGGKDVRSID